MMYFLLLLLSLIVPSAHAQGCGPSNPNCIVPTAPQGTSDNRAASTAFVQKAIISVSVYSYGAKCDGITDDTVAINNAFAAVRVLQNLSSADMYGVQFPFNSPCAITGPINVAGFRTGVAMLDARIICAVTGAPCIDGLFSRQLFVRNLNMTVGVGFLPTFGLQIGRIDAQNSDLDYLDHISIEGPFSKCALYNYASELTTLMKPWLFNTGGQYALCMDGLNRFGVTSTFVGPIVAAGTAQSFLNNVIINGQIGSNGGVNSVPMWIGNLQQSRFINSYACAACSNVGTADHWLIMDFESTGAGNLDLYMDMNWEAQGQTGVNSSAILITSLDGTTQPQAKGLELRHETTQTRAGQFIFGLDTGIQNMTWENINVSIDNKQFNSPSLFQIPSVWTVSGGFRLPAGVWNFPLSFSGRLCEGQNCRFIGAGGTVGDPSLGVGGVRGFGVYNPGGALGFVSNSVRRASILSGGAFLIGQGTFGYATNGGTSNPLFQAQDNTDSNSGVVSANGPYRSAFSINNFSTLATSPSVLFLNKSNIGTIGLEGQVASGDALGAVSAQGSDGQAAQEAFKMLVTAGGATAAGTSRIAASSASIAQTATIPPVNRGGSGYTPGTFTLTAVGGTCTVQPQVSVTADGTGTVATIVKMVDGGVCTVAPTNPNAASGGTGSNAFINFNYVGVKTPGTMPGAVSFQTATSTWYAVLPGSDIAPGTGGTGYTDGAPFNVTIPGGTCTTQPVYSVSSTGGVLTTINSVVTPGSCTAPPMNPVAVVGGTGANGKMWVAYSALVEAFSIDTSQQLFAPQVAQTPGGKKILCIDDANGHIYKANAGVC